MKPNTQILCKLNERIFRKSRRLESITRDESAKCNIFIHKNGELGNEGSLETSTPVDLYQYDFINFIYELEFDKPISNKINDLIIPISIEQYSMDKMRTVAKFKFINILENKKKCIAADFKIACALSEIGIDELLNVHRSFYGYIYLSLLLLSWSFERLIKCLINLLVVDNKVMIDPLPYPTIGKEGHNLNKLVEILLSMVLDQKYYQNFNCAKNEIKYIQTDVALKKLIKILTHFGEGARYFYVDIILGGTSEYRCPANLWDHFENLVHIIRGIESPPAGSKQLEKEMKQLTIEPLKRFREILICLVNLVGRNKFSDFDQIDTTMMYRIDFNL